MNGIGSVVGIGVIVGVLIGLVVLILCNSNRKIKTDYDERQEAIRGKGFKYSAYTAWILLVIYMLAEINEINLHMNSDVVALTIFIISAMVQVSHSIWNDAYWGENNNIRTYAIVLTICLIINVSASIASITNHTLIVDGNVTWRAISVECSLVVIITGIQAIIRGITEKKKLGSEEED